MTNSADELDIATIKLPMKFDLAAAEEVQTEILQAVESGRRTILDAENINTITTPAIQMILSANMTLVNDLKAIQIISPSDSFVDSFSQLGLFDRFMQLEFL